MVMADGRVMIFAHAHRFAHRRLWPTIAGVEDRHGVLRPVWTCTLNTVPGDSVHSAPGLHAPSRTLFVTTSRSMFLFRDVDRLTGQIPSPAPLAFANMVSFAASPRLVDIALGSPIAITSDAQNDEIVVYTNFRATTVRGAPYGYLGAFALPATKRMGPRPLWTRPLGLSSAGRPIPGPGTVGQPALFRYDDGRREATGIIVNTVYTGTYIIT
jgi:hypothetical protein